MAITKQNIVDAYNSIYSSTNNGILKTYEQLNENELYEALLILLNNNSGSSGGGGSGATAAEVKTVIETATNISDVDVILEAIAASASDTSGSLAVLNDTVGLTDDSAASSDTGTFTLIGFIKRLLSVKLPDAISNEIPTRDASARSTLNALAIGIGTTNELPSIQDTTIETNVRLGSTTESAPTTDTGSSGISGRLQRIAQRITALINLLPISLGQKTSANSFPVVLPSDYSLSISGSANKYVAGTIPDTTTNQIILIKDAIDTYESLTIQFSTITLGTITFEVSNNNTIWESIQVYNVDTRSTVSSVNISNTTISVPTAFRYVRMIFTPNVSATGSISAYNIALTNGRLDTTNPLKTSVSGTVITGTIAATVLSADPTRKKFIITNPASNSATVYLGTSTNFSLSSTNYMIALAPGDVFMDDNNVMTDAINGVASAASTQISVTYWV